MSVMIRELISQFFKKPATNPFPAVYAPKSTLDFLKAVGEGKAKILPPVPVPEGFRGGIEYDAAKCIGCRLCTRVCPANAIEFIPDRKKVLFHLDRCCFCGECKDICPVQAIELGKNFLLAYYDRSGPDALVAPPPEEAKPEVKTEVKTDESESIVAN